MTNDIILQAKGLKKYYGKGETMVRALDGVDLAIQRGLRMLHHHRRITPELFAKYRRRYSPHGSVASLYLWEIAGGAVAGLRDWAPKGGEAKRPRPGGAKGGPRGD